MYGTNTKELKCISPSVDNNDKFTTVFSIPNYLNEGTYFVTLGITDQSNGEIVTIDRLIDVTFVRVLSDSKCIGLVNLNVGELLKLMSTNYTSDQKIYIFCLGFRKEKDIEAVKKRL